MRLFKLTPRKRVNECASRLAAEFSRHCPLPEDEPKASFEGRLKHSGRAPSETAIERAMAEVFAQAKAFRQENRLGVLNRARLAKRFQAELSNMGYPSELVSQVTTALVAAALTGD